MDKIIALTRQQREAILQHLTANQVQALSEFTRYAMLSRFHTHHYLKQTDWEFQGMVIDPWYQRQHDHPGDNLYCDCGRRLKNQFILRSRTSGRQLFLIFSSMPVFLKRLQERFRPELTKLICTWIVFFWLIKLVGVFHKRYSSLLLISRDLRTTKERSFTSDVTYLVELTFRSTNAIIKICKLYITN